MFTPTRLVSPSGRLLRDVQRASWRERDGSSVSIHRNFKAKAGVSETGLEEIKKPPVTIASVSLTLPQRSSKPRSTGLTMMIDKGLSSREFEDLIESHGEHVDFVKFGWGTSVVTKNFQAKLDVLRAAKVDFYLGGTLFEKYVQQNLFDEFRSLCEGYGCSFVEVSNGTIDITNHDKAEYVKRLS
jgi:(2R)-phospho-3-sulfolactate synthase (ComA)